MNIHNQFINDNFAIILEGTLEKYNYDIHINDWVVYPFGSYIDFGLRIHNILSVNSLSMYIPYKIGTEDVKDLAPLLGDEKIARALTNTSAQITASTSSPIIEINYYGLTESIIFLSILNLSTHPCDSGTIINLFFDKAHKYIKNDNGYIRFRIPHKSLDLIFASKKHEYKFNLNNPIITEKYQHTIKVNEFRSLPPEIRQEFSVSKQCIKKGHFFLTTTENLYTGENVCENIRPLEYDLFHTYIPYTFKSQNAIVYQWIRQPKKYLIFNFKCSVSKVRISSIFIYSIIIIFLSICANLLFELLKFIPLFSWLK